MTINENNFYTELFNNPKILIVEKDVNLRFLNCNSSWLKAANFKNKDEALGLTDRDCAWKEFSDICEQYEKDILSGQAYGLINPAFVENGRYCWLHNYKWPKLDENGNIIGVNVIAYEIHDYSKCKFLFMLTKKNKFGIDRYEVNKPIKETLTKREKEVLFYLCHGIATKKIAFIMNISYRTVEVYIANIKLKFHCKSKSQIIEYAVAKGYISILPSRILTED